MHEKFMKQCLELASAGMGKVAPNPMVGSIIVHDGEIIGKGYHTEFGKPHAEVEAIRSVDNKNLLSTSTLYVNLEPCNHFGKTPPCTDLILENKIPEVIIGNLDPNPIVSGKGIKKLEVNGVKVITGILEKESTFLNRRFFTFHSQKRPYVILKWAQTKDGYIDKIRQESSVEINKISSDLSHQVSHRWRSEENAILVGKNTVLNDNPELTTRLVKGKNPTRIVIDKNLETPSKSKIYDNNAHTIVLNSIKEEKNENIHFHLLNSFHPKDILNSLYLLNIQSIIIEGGAFTLQQFINDDLWDEARIFTSSIIWKNGLKAPEFSGKNPVTLNFDGDQLKTYYQL